MLLRTLYQSIYIENQKDRGQKLIVEYELDGALLRI